MSLAALEAALAAAPDDPLVLAAYADCLLDAGDPRGEFVRLQLLHDDPGCPDRRAVERELRRLWLAHSPKWLPVPVQRLGRVGFYHLDGDVPLARLRALTPAAPRTLRESAVWWLLRGVWVEGTDWLGPADYGPLFAGLCRSRVRTLAVSDPRFRDDGVDALLASGLFERLTEVRLVGCGVTDTGAEALAVHPHTPRLKLLDLDRNHLSPLGHGALAAVGVAVSHRQRFMADWDFDPPAFPN